jgi:sugar (pentulose or hexulose) kinase
MINSERPAFGPGLTFICPDVVRKGLWLHCGGEVSTGSVIAWFKNQFAFKEAEEARKKNKRVYEVLDEEAAEIPIGSEGVTVLEHWQGSRIYADPLSRGVIRGLSLNTTRAHIFRAIMEACAYSTNLGLEILRERGVKIEEIRACGGGAASRLLLQIHADVTGLPIYLTEIPEAGSLGSAILGAVAADQYKDLFEACSNMVHVKEKVEPNEENHDNYKFYYEIYKKIYPKMKDLSHEATMHLLSK